MPDKRHNPRSVALMLDLLHIVVGILVVICAILVFSYPDDNQILFPVIFWLAALLNAVNGWVRLHTVDRGRRRLGGGILLCAVAAVLFVVGVVSAISLWT
ncbi:MAG: hypothetical protein LIO92_01380 [Clostridiales bacterium]|nr:hypothetical protein [Clostridiales bacterium]